MIRQHFSSRSQDSWCQNWSFWRQAQTWYAGSPRSVFGKASPQIWSFCYCCCYYYIVVSLLFSFLFARQNRFHDKILPRKECHCDGPIPSTMQRSKQVRSIGRNVRRESRLSVPPIFLLVNQNYISSSFILFRSECTSASCGSPLPEYFSFNGSNFFRDIRGGGDFLENPASAVR